MTSPYPDESGEQPAGPVMFLEAAGRPGRPRSTSMSESTSPSSSQDPSPPPAESSTSPDPSWSTEPPPPFPSGDGSEPPSDSPGSGEGLTLGQILTRGLAGTTEVLHNTATDDVGRAYGQWLATDRELIETGEGAAGLLSRRIPAGAGSPDAADLIRVGIAVASYATRQWQTWKRVRTQRKAIQLAAQDTAAAGA